MMIKPYLITGLCVILHGSLLVGQNNYTFSRFGTEAVRFVKQPTKWNGNDYLKIGLIGAGTGLMMVLADQPIRDAVQRNPRYAKSAPVVFGRMWGEFYTPLACFGGFATYSLITGDQTARKIAFEMEQATLYAAPFNFLLRIAVGRARPNLDKGTGTYRPFYSLLNEDYRSCPSGHVTAAFSISTVLSRNVKPVWLKILVYAPAVLTMTSRVYQDWHWTSDCVLGAAIGYLVGTWAVDQHATADKTDAADIEGHAGKSRSPLRLMKYINVSYQRSAPNPANAAGGLSNGRSGGTERRFYLMLNLVNKKY